MFAPYTLCGAAFLWFALVWLALGTVFLLISDCDPWLFAATQLQRLGWRREVFRRRVVWITGASSGIGAQLAVELARHGARLALTARRLELLEEVRERCVLEAGARADDVLILPLDVTRYDLHASALQSLLERFGRLDTLVLNAGRSQRGRWLHTEPAVDRLVFELNVLAPVQMVRVALPEMLKAGSDSGISNPHVVVMSSTAGTVPAPNSCAYTGAKHCLHGYFDALRVEMAASGVRVTLLCPGPTHSQILESACTEREGRSVGESGVVSTADRMSVHRCARLCVAAMCAGLPEAWMAVRPVLLLQYVIWLCPTPLWALLGVCARAGGSRWMARLRDGKLAEHENTIDADKKR